MDEDEIDRLIEAIGTAKRWQGMTASDIEAAVLAASSTVGTFMDPQKDEER
jgi:hypothetical protein